LWKHRFLCRFSFYQVVQTCVCRSALVGVCVCLYVCVCVLYTGLFSGQSWLSCRVHKMRNLFFATLLCWRHCSLWWPRVKARRLSDLFCKEHYKTSVSFAKETWRCDVYEPMTRCHSVCVCCAWSDRNS